MVVPRGSDLVIAVGRLVLHRPHSNMRVVRLRTSSASPTPVTRTVASGLSDLFFAGDCVWSDVHFGFELLGFDFFDFNHVLGT